MNHILPEGNRASLKLPLWARRRVLFLFLALIVLFAGCSTFENNAWDAVGAESSRGTIRITSVSADKSGEWGSLEKEINDLLPLLFREESYLVVSSSASADYSVEVKVREREFTDGWRTKRSLSVELRLWAAGDTGTLPLSAGRAIIQGKQSLASSKTLSSMLRTAVKNAVKGLPAREANK